MAEFKLSVAEIESQGRKAYSFAVGVEWLGTALADTELRPGDGGGALEISGELVGEDILVRGSLVAGIVVPCSRCNAPLEHRVEESLTHVLTRTPETRFPEELELNADDLDRDVFNGEWIELDELVREAILLSVPMQPTHDESVCDPEVMKHLAKPGEGASKRKSPLAALADLRVEKKEK